MASMLGNIFGSSGGSNMGNNPMQMMVGLLKNGGNPQVMFQQMINQNPQMAETWKQLQPMIQGKSDQEIQQMVMQLAKQKGVDINQLMSMFGK